MRVAAALRDVPADERPEQVAVPREYRLSEGGDVVERFIERISEYKTTVCRVSADEVASVAADRCRLRGVGRLGVPSDLPAAWRPGGVEVVPAGVLDVRALDALDGAMTGCALAIAETGTIVLDAGEHQGGRALSLVPDYHLCVVGEEQIVGGVPEAMAGIAVDHPTPPPPRDPDLGALGDVRHRAFARRGRSRPANARCAGRGAFVTRFRFCEFRKRY